MLLERRLTRPLDRCRHRRRPRALRSRPRSWCRRCCELPRRRNRRPACEPLRQRRRVVLPSVADVAAPVPSGEGFGLVYAVAGAFGVPAIASVAGRWKPRLRGARPYGIDGPSRDREALAIAMFRLLEDRSCASAWEKPPVRVRERHLMPHSSRRTSTLPSPQRRQPAVGC